MQQMKIPTLILVEHVAHGRYLTDSLNGFIFLNGQDESSSYNMQAVKEFNQLQHPCLIGTSVLGEGVDTKACGAIFNLAGGKARSELMQRCGRAIRNFPNKKCGYYFDFVDNRSKFLEKHSKMRANIITDVYGAKITYLNR
jgi:superfamily II DNA or RNA helicase